MRILFLYDFPLWGSGSGTFLRELAQSLLAMGGNNLAIVAPDERKLPGCEHFVVYPPQLGVFEAHPELPKAKKYSRLKGDEITKIYTTFLLKTIEAVRAFRPDVIHVHHLSFIAPVARYVKAFFEPRYVITSHGSDLHYLKEDKRYYGLIYDAVRIARQITANSKFTTKLFIEMFGEEFAGKTRTIYGGVNLKMGKGKNDFSSVDKEYNLAKKRVVLFSGRLTKQKGARYLVEAAEKIRAEILIVGDGPERRSLEELVKKRSLKNVHLLGYLSREEEKKLEKLYRRADVYVAPSVWDEPLGLGILEAMACKTPVVATQRGGIPVAVTDGVSGFLVEPKDISQLVEKVNLLLEDKNLRKAMGKEARATVEEKFGWDKIAEEFYQMYERAIAT